MGLNRSDQQILKELNLHKDDAQKMTSELHQAVADNKSLVALSEAVEFDEVYVISGHKGQPEVVKKGRQGCRRKLKEFRGHGPLETEKPSFLMIQWGGDLVIRMLANVQQRTIEPILKAIVAVGSLIYTDEYDIVVY
jgi:hypothetical protein